MQLAAKIRTELMHRAGTHHPAVQMWSTYISFLESCPSLPEHTPETAVHHILWWAGYPKFRKSQWNLIRLSHPDHVAAAALALAAEPTNAILVRGFASTLRLCGVRGAWTPKNPQEIITLYLEKRWTPARIGKRYKVSAHCVYDFLRRHKTPVRDNQESHRHIFRHPEELVTLYVKEGKGIEEIAKRYSVAWKTVQRSLQQSGVRIRPRKIGLRWNPTHPTELMRLYRQGWSLAQLGRKYDVTLHAVSSFLRRKRIKIRTRSEASFAWHLWRKHNAA